MVTAENLVQKQEKAFYTYTTGSKELIVKQQFKK